jgi:hypothetical protein
MITKANEIEEFLEDYMNSGITDLSKIYDMIEEQTNFPRPTIRRVAREYRIRLEEHCKILNSNCVNLLVH